jgi:MarR family transcriptional regulator, temperature-dependent positive regulator of motility
MAHLFHARTSPIIARSFVERPGLLEDEIHYRLLKVLEETPDITQRELAAKLGVSLGKANYCLRAVVQRGWVKMGNFRRNPNKIGYVYLLTPSGIEEKARFAVRFLRRKQTEFDLIKAEIARLQEEVGSGAAYEAVAKRRVEPKNN